MESRLAVPALRAARQTRLDRHTRLSDRPGPRRLSIPLAPEHPRVPCCGGQLDLPMRVRACRFGNSRAHAPASTIDTGRHAAIRQARAGSLPVGAAAPTRFGRRDRSAVARRHDRATAGPEGCLRARETGGLAVAITPNGDLPTSFHRALQEFRDSYVLHFVPTGVERSGAHQLTVRVKRDGVEVRARRNDVRK